ncbi:hypothetical protein DO021_07295 [Desulfobacter hydrogenophilus]|uniref:Uncharacterized protein n=1 Tax=Desulfobacter hydrogenophilus TaxID=2291 RepID=A0A328FEN4_9BACT|nr:hypothetical protein [Desulfobacter hydrogenophilus]NDY71860.1 hypothetical protein [Desulfobacter hydrogenophilus]QBH12006.1 hypothetical protein EYB58_03135 [Desulfobacter hydrogenophilus]RAM02636.1 hypothetical protein DO021_07295 [Desulfobacter hydrogenophilus]
MSHSITYIIYQPGHYFNRLMDPLFRALPGELAELLETDSLWDGKLSDSSVEFSVELSGFVTVLWLSAKYSVFLTDTAEQKKVLEFESKLISSLAGTKIFRLDELLLERWELLSGEEWFRFKNLIQEFSNWIVSQDTDNWLELNSSLNENEYNEFQDNNNKS